jgi:hypothetical protein
MAKCAYCSDLFKPVRAGHCYCSDICRKLKNIAKKKKEADVRRSRRVDQKLKILSGSSFGQYFVPELKRAGTVQILSQHISESLNELVALRRKCTTSSGCSDGESLGTYELSHI